MQRTDKRVDWESLRALISEIDVEEEIRKFGDYWVKRLPNGLTDKQINFAGG